MRYMGDDMILITCIKKERLEELMEEANGENEALSLFHSFQRWTPKVSLRNRLVDFYCWIEEREFEKVVVDVWLFMEVNRWGAFVFKEKIKELKRKIKEWNKDHFDNVHIKIQEVEKEMNDLDRKKENINLSEEEITQRRWLQ
uniref:Reverse transcriptase domain-containing protein n=1 Tax=Cajanus cajan TaxID=3821 RepID=A0A151RMX7_CAJCA|nr:hypothetical protein KK1_034684 [Cajanus cajan]